MDDEQRTQQCSQPCIVENSSKKATMIALKKERLRSSNNFQRSLQQNSYQLFRDDNIPQSTQLNRPNTSSKNNKFDNSKITYKFQIPNIEDQECYQKGMEHLRNKPQYSKNLQYVSIASKETVVYFSPGQDKHYQSKKMMAQMQRNKKENINSLNQCVQQKIPQTQPRLFFNDKNLINFGKQMLQTGSNIENLYSKNYQEVTTNIQQQFFKNQKKKKRKVLGEKPSSRKSGRLILGPTIISQADINNLLQNPNEFPDFSQNRTNTAQPKKRINQKTMNLYKSQSSNFKFRKDIKDFLQTQKEQSKYRSQVDQFQQITDEIDDIN